MRVRILSLLLLLPVISLGWEVVQLVGLQTLEPFNTRINTGVFSVLNNLTSHSMSVCCGVFHPVGSRMGQAKSRDLSVNF